MAEIGQQIQPEQNFAEFPEYLALFATSYRRTHKILRNTCHDILYQVLEQSYDKFKHQHQVPSQQSQYHLQQIEQDLIDFQTFRAPSDNYHLTCLYIGKDTRQLKQQQKGIYSAWNQGVRLNIQPSFIVYIPGYLMAAYCPQVGNVKMQNTCPHITVALKGGATAVQSNFVLQALMAQHPHMFEDRKYIFTKLQITVIGIKRCVFVINHHFKVEMEASSSKAMSKITI